MHIQIDLSAIQHNAQFIRENIRPSKLCAVVKNDAYGHGLVEVATAIKDTVQYFAVGSMIEARRIVNLGVPILVLLPQYNQDDILYALANGICLTVDSDYTLQQVANVAKAIKLPIKVHIKVDTGMSRLGFDAHCPQNWLEAVCDAGNSGLIDVVGVYSHFASADCDATITHSQAKLFDKVAKQLEQRLSKNVIKHLSNSCATFDYKQYHYDMVRCGLALYGYGNSNLIPAKQVTANVIATKHLTKGSAISYESQFVCPKDMDIAVLDIGYANGLDRVLSGNVAFAYQDKLLPQLGKICMAMCMVDNSVANMQVGDNVTLLSATHYPVSNQTQYSTYQLLCDLR